MKNLIFYSMTQKKKKTIQMGFLLFCLSLFSFVAVQAQSEKYTLKMAVERALKQNRSVRMSQLEEVATQAKRKEALSYLYPTINGSAGYTHNLILPTNFIPASAFGGPEGQYNAAKFGLKNSMNAGITASQILFNQAVFNGLKSVKVSQELSQIATRQEQENLVLQVNQAYYMAWITKAQIDLLNKNLQSIEKTAKISELNYQNGVIRKSDYERILVNKTNLESQIQGLESSHNQQLNLLNYLLDLPMGTKVELSEDITNPENITLENVGDVSSQRTDYKKVIKQQELNIQERKVLEAGYYPSLNATFQYNYNWQNNKFSELARTPFKYDASSIGLSLQVPIFDGLQKSAKIQQNKIQRQKLEIQSQMLKDNSQMEVLNAQNKLISYQKTLSSQLENQKLAERLYQQTSEEYAQGTAGINDLLNQENALREAQNQYLSALANRLIAEVELKKASGKLLEF